MTVLIDIHCEQSLVFFLKRSSERDPHPRAARTEWGSLSKKKKLDRGQCCFYQILVKVRLVLLKKYGNRLSLSLLVFFM